MADEAKIYPMKRTMTLSAIGGDSENGEFKRNFSGLRTTLTATQLKALAETLDKFLGDDEQTSALTITERSEVL